MANTVSNEHFSNKGYAIKASYFKRFAWYFVNILFFINPLNPFYGIKRALLRLFGAKIGKGIVIKPNVNIKYPWLLEIGDFTWVGEGVWIDNLTNITIGSHVTLSQGAVLLTGNHNYKKPFFDLMTAPIVLEDGVWICSKAVVCPGVTCGSHAVLLTGSILTKNALPYSIYQGNPAQKIRTREIQ